MRNYVRFQEFDGEDQLIFKLSLTSLALILHADVVALIAADDAGTFIMPRPTMLRQVVAFLASVKWPEVVHAAAEHEV